MTELKPCPFCGGIANVMQDRHYPKWFVGCNDDNCLGFSGLGWLYGSKQQAIEAWNTRYEPTCHYCPDVTNTAFDENDNEIETGEAHPDGCDYSCSNCGNTMLGGDDGGWFDETEGEYGGWDYKPRFNYCPHCGAKVIEE